MAAGKDQQPQQQQQDGSRNRAGQKQPTGTWLCRTGFDAARM